MALSLEDKDWIDARIKEAVSQASKAIMLAVRNVSESVVEASQRATRELGDHRRSGSHRG